MKLDDALVHYTPQETERMQKSNTCSGRDGAL